MGRQHSSLIFLILLFTKPNIEVSGIAKSFPHPTIYLLPEFEVNWPKKDRVIEWGPFEGGAHGAVALRSRCYVIPHPTIYLPPEFEANCPKNDRVIAFSPKTGNGAAAPLPV